MKTELEFLQYIENEIATCGYGEGISYNLNLLKQDIAKRRALVKNNVVLGDVSKQRELLIAFSKWWNGQEYSKDSKELDAFDEYYSNL